MKLKLYYNPTLDLLGVHVGNNYIRIYIHEGMRTYFYNTGRWEAIGSI